MSGYTTETNQILVVDGVEVDITVRDAGAGEDRVDKVHVDLKDHLGWVAQAYEDEKPPDELEARDPERTPLMSVNWESLFEVSDE